MQKHTFNVTVKVDPTEENSATEAQHTVVVGHGDMLRAELEIPKNGLPTMDKAPLHATTCWVWAALTRQKLYNKPFAVFLRTDCLDLDKVEGGAVDVDPTATAALSGSPSF